MKKYKIKGFTINLSHHCNFACDYCYQNSFKSNPDYCNSMSIQDLVDIQEYLKMNCFESGEIDEIVISGGEPLLEENVEAINYICNNFLSKRKSLYTNGVNILKFKDRINFDMFDEFQISFDGPTDVIKAVNHANYDATLILKGISYLLSRGKRVKIATMWTRNLEAYLDEYIDVLKDMVADNPSLSVGIVIAKDFYHGNVVDEKMYSSEYILTCMKKYNPKLANSLNCGIDFLSEISFLRALLSRPINSQENVRYRKCDITKTVPLLFEANGEVHWCMCMGNEKGIVGNFKKKEVFLDRILERGNRSIYTIEKCKKCKLRYICSAGCMLGLKNSENINDPVCGFFQDAFFWEHMEEFLNGGINASNKE